MRVIVSGEKKKRWIYVKVKIDIHNLPRENSGKSYDTQIIVLELFLFFFFFFWRSIVLELKEFNTTDHLIQLLQKKGCIKVYFSYTKKKNGKEKVRRSSHQHFPIPMPIIYFNLTSIRLATGKSYSKILVDVKLSKKIFLIDL